MKGEQECTCSFILEWIHGPQVGTLTVLALENICRVRLPTVDEEIDPSLTSFLNEAKEKIENTFSNSIESSLAEGAYDTDNNASRLRKRYKGSSSQRLDKASLNILEISSWLQFLNTLNILHWIRVWYSLINF